MNLRNKWLMLMVLVTMSLKSFSQTVTDTTSIQLPNPIAKLVIKDLIEADGVKQELKLTQGKIILLENKIAFKDSIILGLDSKINNLTLINNVKDDQLDLSKELSLKLQRDLKIQKIKTKLSLGAGLVGIVGVLIVVK